MVCAWREAVATSKGAMIFFFMTVDFVDTKLPWQGRGCYNRNQLVYDKIQSLPGSGSF
jgi:hypothetical protein